MKTKNKFHERQKEQKHLMKNEQEFDISKLAIFDRRKFRSTILKFPSDKLKSITFEVMRAFAVLVDLTKKLFSDPTLLVLGTSKRSRVDDLVLRVLVTRL